MRARLMLRFSVLMGICAILTGETFAQGPKIKVLIVDGYSNHDWKLTTRVIQAVLAADGRFDVAVSTVPRVASDPTSQTAELMAWEPNFKNYDVVLQNCNDINKAGPRWPARVEKELEDYVSGGGGLFVYHSANNAFTDWAEYNKMIGLGWRNKNFGKAILVNDDGTTKTIPAGEGFNTTHGPRSDVLVTTIGDHPIHAGLPKQFMVADIEVYTYCRGPAENLSVISYGEDLRLHLKHPIEWTVGYGKGRVYVSTLGHIWPKEGIQPSACCAAYQTLMVRALEWLAKRPVDPTAPADFPTAAKISIRKSPLPGEDGPVVGYTSTKGHDFMPKVEAPARGGAAAKTP